eukprot:10614171-Ditylum_brightwellii.AAC.1
MSGKRYECIFKRLVTKDEQMLINYYFDEENVEGEERLECACVGNHFLIVAVIPSTASFQQVR